MTHTTTSRFTRFLACSALAGLISGVALDSAEASPLQPSLLLAAPVLEGQLNVNTATSEQWELLPGIGPSIAGKIVAYRAQHPFKDLTHLMRVKGVGRKTFEQIKSYLTLAGTTTLAAMS